MLAIERQVPRHQRRRMPVMGQEWNVPPPGPWRLLVLGARLGKGIETERTALLQLIRELELA
jgi:hypothetical protein